MTGWDNRLNQDYDKKLSRWFSERLGARYTLLKALNMIRNNPAHDTKTPAGTWKNPVLEQEKPLTKSIEEYQDILYAKADKEGRTDFELGYRRGYEDALKAKFPTPTSEAGR